MKFLFFCVAALLFACEKTPQTKTVDTPPPPEAKPKPVANGELDLAQFLPEKLGERSRGELKIEKTRASATYTGPDDVPVAIQISLAEEKDAEMWEAWESTHMKPGQKRVLEPPTGSKRKQSREGVAIQGYLAQIISVEEGEVTIQELAIDFHRSVSLNVSKTPSSDSEEVVQIADLLPLKSIAAYAKARSKGASRSASPDK